MYSKINKVYIFNKNFNYYIDYLYNKIIIVMNSRYFLLKLPSIFFFNKLNKKVKESFILLTKFHYITFLKHLFNFYNSFFCFYYYILKLKGLGYRVFQVSKNLIKIYFNRSNFFYLHIPYSVLLKYRTRKFFFISSHYNTLKVMILRLLLLKEFIVYKISGIFYTRQIILIKPGKNKYR